MVAGQGQGSHWLKAGVHGAVIGIEVQPGDVVAAGQLLLVQEAMKMEVPLEAPARGRVRAVAAAVGEVADEGAPLIEFEPLGEAAAQALPATAARGEAHTAAAPPRERANLARLRERRALTLDAARPEAVARRHATGLRMARENIAHLLDAGSFTEYGAFAVAAQRSRRALDELQRQTPADGLVTGHGTVGGRPVAVMAYDYTVLAGTQGMLNHKKSDRLLELCHRQRWPLVLWAEGGGGRPGDVDWPGVAGLDCTTFGRLAALSGQVPLVGLVAGRCFAGNAALLGCCDLVVAVEGASIGMGGPAMIEGGGLGRVDADAVGPVETLARAGVIDVRVPDEAGAVEVARHYLALVGAPGAADPAGQTAPGADPATLRQALPDNRNALYDPRRIVETVLDAGSVLELRRDWGTGVITVLGRLAGRAVAVAASNPRHLGGALDAPACDKLARFMQLADAHGLPLVTFVDTPGFMVGPDSEKTAMVRHAARLFVNAAALRVPMASVVLRRGYGLGAMALTAGHFHAPVATCAWPNGEFGPMGLEGAVRLGFRKELEAAPPGEREALFQRLLAAAVERGEALNMASHLEVDDVIDPADTRDWLVRVLTAACAAPLPPRRGFIDAW
ncbi:MAG: biotin carboxylase [Betaproteobacteria bacterium]|nr:biotin carboxylase [Betaproteobacteria bacterium]MCC6249965.1 biotin carboxylase [Rubrivivax sp.]